MHKIKQALSSRLEKDAVIMLFKFILGIIGLLSIVLSTTLGVYISIEYESEGFLGGISTFILGVILSCSVLLMLRGLFLIPFYLMEKLYNKGVSIIELGETEKKRISNAREILESIDTLYSTVRKFIWMKNVFGFFLTKQTQRALSIYSEIICVNAIMLIMDLQEDIIHEIGKKQSLLAKAKFEVLEYIHGTTELNQVSEVQRIRLDHQIEQFEKLQRVIVKM